MQTDNANSKKILWAIILHQISHQKPFQLYGDANLEVFETEVSGEAAEKLRISQSRNEKKWARCQNRSEEEEREVGNVVEQIEACEGGGRAAAVKYGTICVPQTSRKSDLSVEQPEKEGVEQSEDAWRIFQDKVQGEVGKLKKAGFLGLANDQGGEEKEGREGTSVLLSQGKAKSRVHEQLRSQQGPGKHQHKTILYSIDHKLTVECPSQM